MNFYIKKEIKPSSLQHEILESLAEKRQTAKELKSSLGLTSFSSLRRVVHRMLNEYQTIKICSVSEGTGAGEYVYSINKDVVQW